MKAPGARTLLLGSRLTGPPVFVGSAYYTYTWWEAGGMTNYGLITIALMLMSAKAMVDVNAYRQFRADWRAMATGEQRSGWRMRPTTIATLVGMLAIGGAMAFASRPEVPAAVHLWIVPAAEGLALLAAVLIVCRAIWRLWPRLATHRLPVVAIAIRKPLLRVPSRAGCYRRLPPYCKQLLKAHG